ncbi:hypothetical protein B0T18DRAFT_485410 [Schizothecium vesticola]|uniref:Uncharacterized protein n=1 Tax=Schizothecium vesticola TaxID=314040 RepID=A0AA40FC81_9PEZI|nr:hypothetical protein B0T18DRAFT_485410 [Schizothecium vesticola]
MPREAMVISYSYLCVALVLILEEDGGITLVQVGVLDPIRSDDADAQLNRECSKVNKNNYSVGMTLLKATCILSTGRPWLSTKPRHSYSHTVADDDEDNSDADYGGDGRRRRGA